MQSTKVQNHRHNKCSAVVEKNCLVAKYSVPYRFRLRTVSIIVAIYYTIIISNNNKMDASIIYIRLSTHCPCGQTFSVHHAFICQKGAIQHNSVRDITTQLFTEVCPKVSVEPTLQLLNGESFPFRSTNTDDGARLDINAQNVWDKSKKKIIH